MSPPATPRAWWGTNMGSFSLPPFETQISFWVVWAGKFIHVKSESKSMKSGHKAIRWLVQAIRKQSPKLWIHRQVLSSSRPGSGEERRAICSPAQSESVPTPHTPSLTPPPPNSFLSHLSSLPWWPHPKALATSPVEMLSSTKSFQSLLDICGGREWSSKRKSPGREVIGDGWAWQLWH